jgi:hypothetical protein
MVRTISAGVKRDCSRLSFLFLGIILLGAIDQSDCHPRCHSKPPAMRFLVPKQCMTLPPSYFLSAFQACQMTDRTVCEFAAVDFQGNNFLSTDGPERRCPFRGEASMTAQTDHHSDFDPARLVLYGAAAVFFWSTLGPSPTKCISILALCLLLPLPARPTDRLAAKGPMADMPSKEDPGKWPRSCCCTVLLPIRPDSV